MIELATPISLDGSRRGVVIGRTFDPKREMNVYDVLVSPEEVLFNVIAERLEIVGACQRGVIGRDVEHNPERPRLLEELTRKRAA
jgi:hypothetical protein